MPRWQIVREQSPLRSPDVARAMGGRIAEAARHARMSLAELSRRVGIPPNGMAQYKYGTRPSLALAAAIAEVTGVRLEWLATGKAPMIVPTKTSTGLSYHARLDRLETKLTTVIDEIRALRRQHD